MKKVLEVKKVNKSFGNKVILKNIELNINKGEIVGIIGRNGSGKTVLLKIISGLYYATDGEVVFYENDNIGVFVDVGFLPNKTGLQNLLIISKLCKNVDKEKCHQLIEKVGLNPFDKTLYKNYSTGMKQRLAFAYTLMEDPFFLILDEPFSGIDKESVDKFRSLLMNLKRNGKTILITSHYQEDINLLCDRVYNMNSGVLKEVKK